MNRMANAPSPVASCDEVPGAADGEYMSERQLSFFRARLNEERDALLNAAKETAQRLQDNEAHADVSDCASLEEDHTLELRVRDRERKQLQRIEQALQRIESGTYGWCAETGEPIGLGRLLARPTTAYSLEAQLRHESKRKMQGA